MKKRKVISAIVLLFITASLNCAPAVDDQAAKNKAVVVQTIDVLNTREYEKLDQFYAQDFKRYCQATPEAKVESLNDFKALLSEWDQQFPDAVYELHLIAAEGDLVAFYMTYSGTQEGQMGPFPPTGKKMSLECAGFNRLENGKIVETWVTWDNLAALTELGHFPPPSAEADK
ncbi:MAG: ester cyclase [Candidatus Zixiibacteriota bacterium]|nr:MAG: ester cyclase [candidate division Zixibacteria bacterium]